MLRTFDIIMIAAMLVAATVTYTIKYDAEKQIAVIDEPAGPLAEPRGCL